MWISHPHWKAIRLIMAAFSEAQASSIWLASHFHEIRTLASRCSFLCWNGAVTALQGHQAWSGALTSIELSSQCHIGQTRTAHQTRSLSTKLSLRKWCKGHLCKQLPSQLCQLYLHWRKSASHQALHVWHNPIFLEEKGCSQWTSSKVTALLRTSCSHKAPSHHTCLCTQWSEQ